MLLIVVNILPGFVHLTPQRVIDLAVVQRLNKSIEKSDEGVESVKPFIVAESGRGRRSVPGKQEKSQASQSLAPAFQSSTMCIVIRFWN